MSLILLNFVFSYLLFLYYVHLFRTEVLFDCNNNIIITSTHLLLYQVRNMSEKKKCSHCGCLDVYDLHTERYQNVWQHDYGADSSPMFPDLCAYVCRKCKHIDWYVTDAAIEAQEKRKKEIIENEKQIEDFYKEREKLSEQINRLRKIISDENQTVKAVNEAKAELEEKERRLSSLRRPPEKINLQPWER